MPAPAQLPTERARVIADARKVIRDAERVIADASTSNPTFEDVVARVAADQRIDLRNAIPIVRAARPDLARAYETRMGVQPDATSAQPTKKTEADDTLFSLASTLAAKEKISLRDAVGRVTRENPDAATAYSALFSLGGQAAR